MVAKCCENRSLTHKAKGHSLTTWTRRGGRGSVESPRGAQVTKGR